MAVHDHPMKGLKGTPQGRALMDQVRAHKQKKEQPVAAFTSKERKTLAATGKAMAGGRYPIRNSVDLENAFKDWIRTGRPSDVAAWIGRRASALDLPNPISSDGGKPANERAAAHKAVGGK